MELAKSIMVVSLLVLCVVIPIFLFWRRLTQWDSEVNTNFQAALKSVNISTYAFLVDHIVPPTQNRTPEVYRILQDQDEHYFLYIHIEGSPGVLKPLTKERALLAAEKSGYGR